MPVDPRLNIQNYLKLTFLDILRAIVIAVTISMTSLVIVISIQLIVVTYNGTAISIVIISAIAHLLPKCTVALINIAT